MLNLHVDFTHLIYSWMGGARAVDLSLCLCERLVVVRLKYKVVAKNVFNREKITSLLQTVNIGTIPPFITGKKMDIWDNSL